MAGAAKIARADGSAVSAEPGTILRQGDAIETGTDGRIALALDDGTTFSLLPDSRIALAEFGYSADKTLSSALVRVSQGSFAFVAGRTAAREGLAIDTPFAVVRSAALGGALVTLTLAAVTVALLRELHAASNEPILLDDLLKFKDLEHGTLGIVPKGGDPRLIVLDDPEMTIVIGPGFDVQQILNSGAVMSFLLGISQEANAIYLLGQADPFTTGSTDGQRSDSGFFFLPDTTIRPVNFFQPLPSLGDDPPTNPFPGSGGSNNAPPQPVLVLNLNDNLIVEHDHSSGVQVDPDGNIDDTDDPFPIDLSDLEGFDPDLVIGQANDGTADDPFVSTAGSSGPVRITVEPSSNGVDSGLDVTGGGSIFLYKENTDGQQVVVGREGGPDGPIAFIIFVTPDGRTLWVQELLPIHHTDPADSPTNISNDPDSIVSILDDVLLVRGRLIGTNLTETAPIGDHIVFVDDAPDAVDDDPRQLTEDAAAIGGNVIDPDTGNTDEAGEDDPGTDGATLTHVKLPGAGDFVAITDGDDSGTPGTYSFTIPGLGTYTFQANGDWTFDPVLNQSGHPVDATFTYRLTDGDGDFDDATQPISVLDGADPTVGQLGLAVEESDLDTGATPAGTGETDSGLLSITAGSDDITTIAFGDTDGIVVQGLLGTPAITWTGEGTDTLTGYINGVPAITLKLTDVSTIDAGTVGTVTVTATLLDNFPHALLGADSVLIGGIQVKASEADGDFGIGQVRMRVLDDVPVASNDSAEAQTESALATVNALFILDKSGSMGSDGDPNSRISLAKAAILDFASQDNVLSIRILPFDGAAGTPSEWFDLTQPGGFEALETFLDNITGGGGTNYQSAISAASQNDTWSAVPNTADLDNVYFISDGAASPGLTDQNVLDWEAFLQTNGIDNAYAVGIGTSVNDVDLQEVAYPNVPDETHNVIIIDSAGDLSATLQQTTHGSVTVPGNVLSNAIDGDNFGADGPGFIRTLRWDSDGDGDVDEFDAVGYRFDGTDIYLNDVLLDDNASEITFITVNGGEMHFNFLTGDWDYTTPAEVEEEFDENFAYTIVDADGDESAPATLDITVLPPPPSYALTGAPDVTEGSPLLFTLTLSHVSATDTVFKLATVDGSATGGTDFETSGFRYRVVGDLTWTNAGGAGDLVTIPTGATAIEIEVDTIDDGFDEPNNESMQLVVQSVVSGTVSAFANDADEIGRIDDNDSPPSIPGGNFESYSIPENTTFVFDVNATDPDGDVLTYSIVNTVGTDFDKFAIDPVTGVLSFITAPDFENPNDIGGTDNNNNYVVVIQVSDGFNTDSQTVDVTVTDVGVANSNAGNDIVRTAASGAGSTTVVPEWALLYNDADLFDVIATGSVSDLTSVSLLTNLGSVTIVNNDSDGGSFTYTATGGDESDTAGVTLLIDTGNISGSGAAEILIGTAGAETIDGNGGADILIGGGGGDTLLGGSGNDLLLYAPGVASINGGSNSSSNLLNEGNRGDVLSVSGTVDFTALADVFEDIETISMLASDGSAGNSTITLNIGDVLDMSDSATANPTGSFGGFDYGQADALRIDGSAGDVLNLGPDAGTWLLATGATGIPEGYVAYAHVTSGSVPSVNEDAYLFVATGITVNGVGT